MTDYSMIYNRLVKNKKKIKNYLQKYNICSYRIFDKDIPEFPYIIDIYDQNAIVFEKGKKILASEIDILEKRELTTLQIQDALKDIFHIKKQNIYLKMREKQKGKDQYERLSKQSSFFKITEGPLRFQVNLEDYLDTGLFLDHRPLRQRLIKESKEKRVLNLFAYTGSLSVAAAYSGARVTTVDMSNTYLDWAKENFTINDIPLHAHSFIRADVIKFLDHLPEKFDTIILDPPSFSNSKKMDDSFDVQQDHKTLISKLMPYLRQGGTLIFSNNYRKFKMDDEILSQFEVNDITYKSIPEDFRDKKIHSCFEITNKS